MLFVLIASSIPSFADDDDKPIEQLDLFVAGEGDYHSYRIPSLIRGPGGTIIAFCEGRRKSVHDSGDIDLLMRRSSDDGRTWSPTEVVYDDGPHTIGNPCPVVDAQRKTIWLLLTQNLGHDNEREIVGETSEGTRRVLVMRSRDDGQSWSPPVDITAQAKDPDWTWYATGPGMGIQLASGRLVIPCDHITRLTKIMRSHVIFSDDHGRSWQRGIAVGDKTNECQVVERRDGSLLINMRSYHGQNCRATALSQDGGLTWTEPKLVPELVDPICQASLLKHVVPGEPNGRSLLIFANPASKKRERLTVRVTSDEGETWPFTRLLHTGPAAYSALVSLSEGGIGCLYERGDKSPYERLTFARIAISQSGHPSAR